LSSSNVGEQAAQAGKSRIKEAYQLISESVNLPKAGKQSFKKLIKQGRKLPDYPEGGKKLCTTPMNKGQEREEFRQRQRL